MTRCMSGTGKLQETARKARILFLFFFSVVHLTPTTTQVNSGERSRNFKDGKKETEQKWRGKN